MMKVEYVDHMGSDLSVVNAARVSFDKESEWEVIEKFVPSNRKEGLVKVGESKELSKQDTKLINFLARHGHWTPFGHTSISLRIKAPIFVARQLGKHQVGLVWNEVSRRYVDSPPEFYEPEVWRKRAENVKQGSSEDEWVDQLGYRGLKPVTPEMAYDRFLDYCGDLYTEMLDAEVCPEMARMLLPQSMMTEWIWTGSVAAFARVCKLRLDPHTQKETRDIAEDISGLVNERFPVSWGALLYES